MLGSTTNPGEPKMLHGSPQERPRIYHQASPAQLLPLGVRQVLIFGEADSSVPVILGKQYLSLARHHEYSVKLIVIPQATYLDLILPTGRAWPAIKSAICDLLNH